MQRRDVVLRLLFSRGAEGRPRLHESAPLVEQVTASIGGLDLAADGVRQRHFGNLARKVRSLGRPIAEA